MVSIGMLLFFILMPLCYKGLELCLSYSTEYIQRYKGFYIIQVIELIGYYVLEAIYIIAHYTITKEWVFMKNRIYISWNGIFIFCAIVFIFISGIFFTDCRDKDEFVANDIAKNIVLIILFMFFMFFMYISTSDNYKNVYFDSLKYEKISEEIIELRCFSDTHTTTGEIHGGKYYINGQIQDNYELYYCFMNEDGSLTIRHFTYTEAHCKIYPEENCQNPRLEITTYAKSYKDKHANYCDYALYIPDDSIIGTGINLE